MGPSAAEGPGAVRGAPRVWLRLEGAAVLALCALLWEDWAAWPLVLAGFFAPDLAFLAYLAGPRAGAAAYNAAHSYVGPVLAGVAGLLGPSPTATEVALVWAAHVGFDRALGYGLKYPTAFGDTHLGRVGRGLRARTE